MAAPLNVTTERSSGDLLEDAKVELRNLVVLHGQLLDGFGREALQTLQKQGAALGALVLGSIVGWSLLCVALSLYASENWGWSLASSLLGFGMLNIVLAIAAVGALGYQRTQLQRAWGKVNDEFRKDLDLV